MATSIIPNTDYKIKQINSDKRLGYFFSAADLDELLNWELETMENNTWRSISVEAKATFGVFVNTYIYHGFLFRSGSTTDAHVILYPNASNDVITGETGNGVWTYTRLATANEVNAVSNAIGALKVHFAVIPAQGTATIRTSETAACLIFTSHGGDRTAMSAHFASILKNYAPQFVPFFTTGNAVSFTALSDGGVNISSNLSTTISLVVIRITSGATITITTASAS